MDITFDPDKNAHNLATRGISFEIAGAFDWSTALIVEDARQDYGEKRYQALGLIDDRLTCWFSPRAKTACVSSA